MTEQTRPITIKWIAPGEDLKGAYEIRTKVFIEEQQVPPELEMDEIDPITDHIVIYQKERPVATGRIVWDNPVSLGRIAVLPEYRGTGLGARIVQLLADKVFARGADEVHLHAQLQAKRFYEKLGFQSYGEEFDEAGIPHISMKLQR